MIGTKMKNLSLSQSSIALITNLVNKCIDGKEDYKKEVAEEIVKVAEAIVTDLSKNNAFSVNELKDEAIDKIRSELATKDFVRAEIAEVRQEIAETKAELKQDIAEVKQEMAGIKKDIKYYGIGIIALIIILQPRVFDFIQSIFSVTK